MAFTYQYSQPEEYHFSLDSIELAQFVAVNVRTDFAGPVLDLCAGCGVIGFELSWHLKCLRKVDFVEVQEVYKSHWQKNVQTVNRAELQTSFLHLNYDELCKPEWKDKYGLVVCNPPYFQVGQGKLSPSDFKNRCRFFIDSSFAQLACATWNVLQPGGSAYLLLRRLEDHGWDLFEELEQIIPAGVQKIGEIRGTDVILMAKPKT